MTRNKSKRQKHARSPKQESTREKKLDEAIDMTFPASDPVSIQPTREKGPHH